MVARTSPRHTTRVTAPRPTLARRAALLLVTVLVAACAGSSPRVKAPQPVIALRESMEDDPEFGGRVFVVEAGAATAPPLVLVHGMGSRGARDFTPILGALSARYHVLAFDLPGFARSTHGRAGYAPSRYARFVRAMIARRFGEQPVAVLGHSMGGAIAIELAGTHPEAVSRLALLDVAGILHYREYLRTLVRAEREDDGFFARARKKVRTTLFDIGWAPFASVKLERLGLASGGKRSLSSSTTAALLFVQHDFGPALRGVRAPTWIGWGAHDEVAPLRTADALRHALAPAAFHRFARSGHVPMETEPDAVVDALVPFLDGTTPPPAPAEPLASTRVGRCVQERDRLFEGDYARIEIYRCKRVILRGVRTRALHVERSEVELRDVQVLEGDVGVVTHRAHVRWSGGHVAAGICLDASHSEVNLLAVTCEATREALRVRAGLQLLASASAFARGGHTACLHGQYQLAPTHPGEAVDFPDPARVGPRHSRTALPLDELSNQHLRGESFVRAELGGVDLSGVDLVGADLREADLQGADLRDSHLERADLRHADLRDADLRDSRLDRADLRHADLRGADLRDSRLDGVDLRDVDVAGARLEGVDLSGADLRGVDLRAAELDGARLTRAKYDARTQLPFGIEPVQRGMIADALADKP